jgi:hypothetical protein
MLKDIKVELSDIRCPSIFFEFLIKKIITGDCLYQSNRYVKVGEYICLKTKSLIGLKKED